MGCGDGFASRAMGGVGKQAFSHFSGICAASFAFIFRGNNGGRGGGELIRLKSGLLFKCIVSLGGGGKSVIARGAY